MNVICIEEVSLILDVLGAKVPQVMDEVTVIRQEKRDGEMFFELAEFPPIRIDNKKYTFIFIAKAFAPLNGPDESARLEEWQGQQLTEVDRLLEGCAEMMPEAEMGPAAFERVWQAIVRKEEGWI